MPALKCIWAVGLFSAAFDYISGWAVGIVCRWAHVRVIGMLEIFLTGVCAKK